MIVGDHLCRVKQRYLTSPDLIGILLGCTGVVQWQCMPRVRRMFQIENRSC